MTPLETQVIEYLRTVEDATPRQIAKTLGENRYRVKQTLEALRARGILDVDLPMLVPEALLRMLFNGTKPTKMARPTDAARTVEVPSMGVRTQVRRL